MKFVAYVAIGLQSAILAVVLYRAGLPIADVLYGAGVFLSLGWLVLLISGEGQR